MSAATTGKPEIRFPDGSRIVSFTSFSAHDNFTDPLPRFEFEATPTQADLALYRRNLKKGEFCTLVINGASQGGFLMQEIKKTISATRGFVFHVQAISPLITPYQGSVDPDIINLHSQTDVPVEEAILKAMRPYGFDSIVSDSRAHVNSLTGVAVTGRARETTLNKLKHQDTQAQDGETAYQFCARLFTRLGVCLRMRTDGVLLIGAPDYTQGALYSLVQGDGDGDRFIGDLEIIESNDDQFSECIVRGKPITKPTTSETTRPKATLTAADAFGTNPSQYRSTPAAHKPKVIRDKHSRDKERCASVAKLALGIRASKAYVVSGTVAGFVAKTGAVWAVDTVVNVRIDADEINMPMWIMERSFHLDATTGATTKLKLIPLGSLLLGDVAA